MRCEGRRLYSIAIKYHNYVHVHLTPTLSHCKVRATWMTAYEDLCALHPQYRLKIRSQQITQSVCVVRMSTYVRMYVLTYVLSQAQSSYIASCAISIHQVPLPV